MTCLLGTKNKGNIRKHLYYLGQAFILPYCVTVRFGYGSMGGLEVFTNVRLG